jgi:hypothetical protein
LDANGLNCEQNPRYSNDNGLIRGVIRKPRDRLTGQPQERERTATCHSPAVTHKGSTISLAGEWQGTRDRLPPARGAESPCARYGSPHGRRPVTHPPFARQRHADGKSSEWQGSVHDGPVRLCRTRQQSKRITYLNESRTFLIAAGKLRRTRRSSMHTTSKPLVSIATRSSSSTGTFGAIGEFNAIHVSRPPTELVMIIGTIRSFAPTLRRQLISTRKFGN